MIKYFVLVGENANRLPGVDYFSHFDLQSITTPIKPEVLDRLLEEADCNVDKRRYLVNGFKRGFDIGYRGPLKDQDQSRNIPFTVGNNIILWNKIMKEVKLGGYAGPYIDIPFTNFMQSPIGLVPKAGNQTRLIFHLSYDFPSGAKSLNYHTPKELCSVKYNDLDNTIVNSLKLVQDCAGVFEQLFYSKMDMRLAFRLAPMLIRQIKWLVMMAFDPSLGKNYYFVDKCMPFGSSQSCTTFQVISDALKALLKYRTKAYNNLTNYLDNFLFAALTKLFCDYLVRSFF